MEKKMETVVIKGLYRDPILQVIPTLGPDGCKYYPHWAIWIPRVRFGSCVSRGGLSKLASLLLALLWMVVNIMFPANIPKRIGGRIIRGPQKGP